ncbi:hypothetical protein DB346_24960 [Verrucomicrobia bacterium LW23]|nr:hypothetical protein DB346_24960 [Verrucomicrobia bacterium LW23]
MLSRSTEAKKGVALVVVLLFVVLLSGIVLAFFARSLSSRKISETNADRIKTELFANGTVESIVGDLRQEIVDGSATPASFADGTQLYVPSGSTNMVPQRIGTADTLPNLVKRSASGVPVFTLASGAGPARASSVSTETESLNGRVMTASRWNKAYLLPKLDPASSTSATPIADFTSPDWIYVSRDGSNPLSWNANLSIKGSNAVLGRYAYCIYDEGGLLNANVAGFPSGSNGMSEEQKSLKGGVPLADLTEILGGNTGGAGFSPTRAGEIVNQLLGWRNYATLQPTGTLPNFVLTSGAGDSYHRYVSSQSKGFLKAGNTSLYNAQSDRAFASRQELMKFLLQGLAVDSGERAKFQSALQYLGTFSRDLDQPSYIPAPGRPKVKASQMAGGNNMQGGDDVVNPSFLSARVAGTFTRNDGTTATEGEPLVKKRFALARLAWITYAGPSADRSNLASPSPAVGGADYDLWLLKNKYGVTEEFLRQGTEANIHKYFGLSWVTDPDNPSSRLWVYSHEGTTPLTAASAAPVAAIRTLTGGTRNVTGREADFFELLKASVHAGSMAKAYTGTADTGATFSTAWRPRVYAATRDADFDAAVIQLGANILSQSSTSGFPVRIMFNNGLFGRIQQYRGVADLPYFYRVREGKLLVRQPVVTGIAGPDVMQSLPNSTLPASALTDRGLAMAVQQLEIWNPHAWNSSRGDTLFRPKEFRVIGLTQDPNGNPTTPINVAGVFKYNPGNHTFATNDTVRTISPVSLQNEQLTAANTEMLFDINTNFDYLFREPALLVKPGVPTNSNLRIGSGHTIKTTLGLDYITTPITGGNGAFVRIGTTDNLRYFGMVIAKNLPAAFAVQNPSVIVPTGMNSLIAGDAITYRVQYKDPNGNWVTYDEKFAPVLCASDYGASGVGSNGGDNSTNTYTWGWQTFGNEWASTSFDPRTGRFGMQFMGRNGNNSNATWDFPVCKRDYNAPLNNASRAGWSIPSPAPGTAWASIQPYMINAAHQMSLWTNRPDERAGFLLSTDQSGYLGGCKGWKTGPSVAGWYPAGTNGSLPVGVLCQNNPAINSTVQQWRFLVDGQGNSTVGLRGFADPDGVMRRGMSAHVQLQGQTAPTGNPAINKPASGAATGLPMRTAYRFNSNGTITDAGDAASRPIILNRPFRSVAELGYVFSGTPWRNVDFITPESGTSAFLDVFCIDVNDNEDALTDGKINLNTRQAPVLRALLVNAYKDTFSLSSLITRIQSSGSTSADAIASGLISRTTDTSTSGAGPLQNVSELVGKWNTSQTFAGGAAPFNIDGGASYTGFSGTTTTASAPPATPANLSSLLMADNSANGYTACVNQRYREAVIRTLSAGGQTRVWNLMIDVVAQTGVCPENATDLSKFTVKGEQRYWVHVAIDRYTGAILDKHIEVVTE